MIVIAMAQILMSFNVNALPVSIGGIVASFDAPPTVVGTAIVTYSLFIAGFVMLGAKIGALFGSRSVFQAMVALFGAAMATMTLSPSANMMIAAQGIAGFAAAALCSHAGRVDRYQLQRQAAVAGPGMAGRGGGQWQACWRFWSPVL
jgi:MFS family permease